MTPEHKWYCGVVYQGGGNPCDCGLELPRPKPRLHPDCGQACPCMQRGIDLMARARRTKSGVQELAERLAPKGESR